jgi:hypothetical protein
MRIFGVLILLFCSSAAFSFDGEREGFVIGLAIGVANVDYRSYGRDVSDTGLATSLKVGYGFDNNVAVYYVRNASTTEAEGYTYMEGISGLGATWYIPGARGVYLLGGVGIGDLTLLYSDYDDDDTDQETGSAWLFGVGYESRSRHGIEFSLVNVDIDDINYKSTAAQLMYSYRFY